jgi:hypothetical protein
MLTLALPAFGQPLPTQLDRVIVSGSGLEQRAFETPYSISVIDAADLPESQPSLPSAIA